MIENDGVSISLNSLLKYRLLASGVTLFDYPPRVHNTQIGVRASSVRGRGMDFAEDRAYQAGDEIRHMDWRVTARTNEPHTKIYHEERNRPVFIIVDYSASMFFGTRHAFKSVVAAEAAALLAWAAIEKDDCLGGFIFSGHHHIEIKPRARKHGVLPFLKALADVPYPVDPEFREDALYHILQRARRVIHPGSFVVILSDFASLNDASLQVLLQLKHHNEMAAGFIFDPLEKNPPPPNAYTVTDGKALMTFDTRSKKIAEEYRTYFAKHYAYLSSSMQKYRISLLEFATNIPVQQVLGK